MYQQLPADHAITVADVEQPGDPSRASLHRPAAHDGLPGALTRAVRKKPGLPGRHAVIVPWLKTQRTDDALIQP